MINLTEQIQVLKKADELSSAVIEAIQGAKQCVMDEFFDSQFIWPTPEEITAGSKNRYTRASVIKFFHGHDDPSIAPNYDEAWIKGLHLATQKEPSKELLLRLIPTQKDERSVCNRTFRLQFKKDALLILHFLYFQGAVLLPVNLKLPTTLDKDTGGKAYEYAANHYPETLAIVRYPFSNAFKKQLLDITEFLPQTSWDNFGWYAWRLIRATDWYRVEDINIEDVEEARIYGPNYPISPKGILSALKQAFPDSCTFSLEDLNSTGSTSARLATPEAMASGSFYVPKELEKHKEKWLYFQDKFIKKKKQKIDTWAAVAKNLAVLNAYLFEEIPTKAGSKQVPFPHEFSRKYIGDSDDEIPNLIAYIQKGRANTTVRGILLSINQFIEYLERNANEYDELKNFKNPIHPDLDFPLLRSSNTTSKAVFSSEHFVPLLQYCYAVEAFGWFLAQAIYTNELFSEYTGVHGKKKVKKFLNASSITYETENLGFIPVVFLKNPGFNEKKPVSSKNKAMKCIPIRFIPKALIPLASRRMVGHKGLTSLPTLNHIQHAIVALETGIRNIHIRWLDRRTYDQKIDRSYELPPVCDLWVNTDKAHDEWPAKVSRSVIEVLDRQKKTHDWFDESIIHEEEWYNNYVENKSFGKILTIFPRGLAGGTRSEDKPGPLSENSFTAAFRKIIFAFDLFCRYSLNIKPSNRMLEEFRSIKSIDTVDDYSAAFKLFEKSKKLIEHTPHSCRATVVSNWITILPPHIIGDYITGHSTIEHVLYYVKMDPSFLKRHEEYQKVAFENGFQWDESHISSIRAEDINSNLQKAFRENKDQAMHDFGAFSYERPRPNGEILSGIRALKKQPLDSVTYHGTHICPYGDQCPKDVQDDLNAIPGARKPCGGCYYSVKTVDHLPRIAGHVRSLTEESAELKTYIDDALAEGAESKSLEPVAERRKFLSDEIAAWSVTIHCLEQMLEDVRTRDHFLVQEPQIVKEHLEGVLIDSSSLENMMFRLSEAKTHAEFFTPQLKNQLKVARAKILKRSGDLNRLLQDEPKGFELIDEFRGIIRSTCETLGISVKELAEEMEKPVPASL
nr:hypothetical protein [uncultured Marinobacter sp.]